MSARKYRVQLTGEERQELKALVSWNAIGDDEPRSGVQMGQAPRLSSAAG